ncbi:hypothetical protein SISNIDRAFT_383222, partial [Sistotremastrum niveocremeum HHB9708]
IPDLNFVECAIAIPKTGPKASRRVIMVEERIPGRYFKYMGNDSWDIEPGLTDPAAIQTANYLKCCQHVAFVALGGQCVIADYQGGGTQLTDAQLCTTPEYAGDFGDGNHTELLARFSSEHVCSRFCEFFRL